MKAATHLWIAVQKLYCLRFCGCRRRLLDLPLDKSLHVDLLFLDNLVGDLVHDGCSAGSER